MAGKYQKAVNAVPAIVCVLLPAAFLWPGARAAAHLSAPIPDGREITLREPHNGFYGDERIYPDLQQTSIFEKRMTEYTAQGCSAEDARLNAEMRGLSPATANIRPGWR